jgi:ADP-heptose:LPS heptosyltransferase/2-polyprenyl-3-methyl-5-hydroxy-6-metoxy-1,4-benzoquinol methylase
MWLVKTNGKDFPEKATGNILGIDFKLGYALIDSQFYYQHLIEHGFIDATPKWMKEIEEDLSDINSQVIMIRWGAWGDNLLCEPAIRAFKEKYPHVKICFAGRPNERRILFGNPIISDWFEGLKHRLVQYVGQYDTAFDFTHSIECNPESEYKDAKEIACEWVGNTPKSGMIPKIYLTPGELTEAQRILKENNIDITKDKIIGIHVESSAPQRTFHPSFTIKLANKLAENNYKVILLGARYQFLHSLHYIKCNKCKRTHEVNLAKQAFEVKCVKCGNKIKYARNPNIVNLVGRIDDARVAVAVVKYLNLLIAPDSLFIHAAQATQTKTLAIYCSFDASTRCKHYKNIYVYQRPFRCAPCFQHGNRCKRWQPNNEDFPPCTKIKVSEVYPLVTKLMKGQLGDYIPQGITPKYNQKCPMCFGREHKLLCRKGNYFYFKCLSCNTIHIDRESKVKYVDDGYYDKIYKTKKYKEGQARIAKNILKTFPRSDKGDLRVLEIGCGIGSFLKEFKKVGWQTLGIEINKYARMKADKLGLQTANVDFEDSNCKLQKKYYNLIVALHTIEHFKDIEGALIKMRDSLYERGKIFIACPDGEGYRNNTYPHLNTYYCGEHIVLPSQKGLAILCNRLGLQVDSIQSNNSNIMAWISKK